MPVRIIFRGLILFRIEGRNTRDGRIIADLIDPPDSALSIPPAGSAGAPTGAAAQSATHSHRHQPEFQAYSGATNGIERFEPNPGRDIDIDIVGSENLVDAHPSYDDHCPKLHQILAEAENPAFREQPWRGSDDTFVRTRVTVNRGTIRVKEVVTWDAGAFPLTDDAEPGLRAATPALVSFRGSAIQGHMASECVIDVDDSSTVRIVERSAPKPRDGESDEAHPAGLHAGGGHAETGSPGPGSFPRESTHVGARSGTLRVPAETVEILFTNFSAQQDIALPWSLHFPWLFRAASYTPEPLSTTDLKEFADSARVYFEAKGMSEKEINEAILRELSLLGPNNTGFPFPYLKPESALTRLHAIPPRFPAAVIADPWNLPLCPQGDNSKPFGGS